MTQGSLYFDPSPPEDRQPKKPAPAPQKRKFLTVTEFTNLLRNLFEDNFADISIAGEISGTKALLVDNCIN